MATRTITALFDRYDEAAKAVQNVEAAGVPHSDVSIVSNDPANREHLGQSDANAGTATGASLGTLLGGGAGLLAGLGMLAIPGLGPVVAAGWLASTLVGAGVGAAAGGIVGSLTDAGISHEDAHLYAEGVNRGGTLVTVRTAEADAARVAEILDAQGAVDLDQRGANYRDTGWSGTYAPTDATASVMGTPLGTPAVPGAPLSGPLSDGDEGRMSAGRRARVYGDGI